MAFLLEASPRAEFVFSYQERSADRCLEPLLAKWGMSAVQVPLAEFGADGPAIASSDLPGNHSVQLYVVTLKQ